MVVRNIHCFHSILHLEHSPMIQYNHRIHSPYLFKPLRTYEEALRDREKESKRVSGS